MSFLLLGFCGLIILINISVTASRSHTIVQKPRIISSYPGRHRLIICYLEKPQLLDQVRWYKVPTYDMDPSQGVLLENTHNPKKSNASILAFHRLTVEDNGVYYCNLNDMWGFGTEVQVVRPLNRGQIERRSRLKDALIIFQGLLLAVIVGAIFKQKQNLRGKEKEIIYEEPETEHIYEGLAFETCDGGLYEDLGIYSEAQETEMPWESN